MALLANIAVVEDDAGLLIDLVDFLTLRGFAVQGFARAQTFLLASTHFDLVLLDIILPDGNGLELAQMLREQSPAIKVIMLTALDSNADMVQGFNAGADIYLSKRSSLTLIEAACQSALRQTQIPRKLWQLHPQLWRLSAPNGVHIDLSASEMTLLAALFGHPGVAVTREQLLQKLNKNDSISNLRNLDNTVSRLKRKVLQHTQRELPIRPSYGKGYTFTGLCEIA